MKKIIIVSLLGCFLMLLGFGELIIAGNNRIILRVDGLACPFCAYGLEKKVAKIINVKSYDVDMKEGKVFIGVEQDTFIEPGRFYDAVKEAGFTLRSISIRVKGKIHFTKDKEGIVLIADENKKQFILFEKDISKSISEDLKKKLLEIKKSDREVIIEGDVRKHEGLYYGLSVDHLEVIE